MIIKAISLPAASHTHQGYPSQTQKQVEAAAQASEPQTAEEISQVTTRGGHQASQAEIHERKRDPKKEYTDHGPGHRTHRRHNTNRSQTMDGVHSEVAHSSVRKK